MAGNNNSSSGTNRMAVPEAKDAMKRFKENKTARRREFQSLRRVKSIPIP